MLNRHLTTIAFILTFLTAAAPLAARPWLRPSMSLRPAHLETPNESLPLPHRLELSLKVHDCSKMPFVEHQGSGPFSNYLVMNVPFGPIENIHGQIKRALRLRTLKKRKEAHITVITPPEFSRVLGKHISMRDINGIARQHRIQDALFKIQCLGLGTKLLGSNLEQTFFLVITSPELLNLRRAIRDKFVAKGGRPSDFCPEHFFPHITVGFTKRDLHESDGVLKDKRSKDKRFVLDIN